MPVHSRGRLKIRVAPRTLWSRATIGCHRPRRSLVCLSIHTSLIGTVLFLKKSSTDVPCSYCLYERPGGGRHLLINSAVLVYLCRELSRATIPTSNHIVGPFILLQVHKTCESCYNDGSIQFFFTDLGVGRYPRAST